MLHNTQINFYILYCGLCFSGIMPFIVLYHEDNSDLYYLQKDSYSRGIYITEFTWEEQNGYIQWSYFWLIFSIILFMVDPKSWKALVLSIFLVNFASGATLLWMKLTKKGDQSVISHYQIIWLISLVYFVLLLIIFWLI